LQKSPYRTSNIPPYFHPFYDPDVSSRAMMDLIIEALACDRTRVVTMAWDEPNVYDWLTDANNQVIQADDWHQDYVHPGGVTVADPSPQRDRLFRVFKYYNGEASYFLDKMKATPEGDGTLLDHSLVLYVNEFSNGSTHSHLGKPYWIAGKLGGMIQ